MSFTLNLALAAVFLIAGIFWMVRTFHWHITITGTQIEIDNGYRSYTVPFTEISGRRYGSKGSMYLYRHGKSRLWVNEQLFKLDDYYWSWRTSIYDLDKADRLKRKASGKERALDWFATDNEEQKPTIGGPNATT